MLSVIGMTFSRYFSFRSLSSSSLTNFSSSIPPKFFLLEVKLEHKGSLWDQAFRDGADKIARRHGDTICCFSYSVCSLQDRGSALLSFEEGERGFQNL